mgnify:CR=1 FL=1
MKEGSDHEDGSSINMREKPGQQLDYVCGIWEHSKTSIAITDGIKAE